MLDQDPELGFGAVQLGRVEVRPGEQLTDRGVVRLRLDYRLQQLGGTERVAGLEEESGPAVLLEKIPLHAPHARAADNDQRWHNIAPTASVPPVQASRQITAYGNPRGRQCLRGGL